MNVDDFINQRSSDGQMESEGSFTVDSLAALRKTLASALPEPHYYLFHILQGLIQAGAGDIKVAIGRRENRISFTDPKKRFSDLRALSQRFDDGLSVSSNDPLELVMVGMTTALSAHINRAEFCYEDERVVVTTDGIESVTGAKSTQPCLVLRRVMEKGMSFSWSRIWGARKEELRVRKRFEHSFEPISIAGLSTSPRNSWRRGVENGQFALVEVAVVAAGEPNHRGEPLVECGEIPDSEWLCRGGTLLKEPEGPDLAIAPNLFVAAVTEAGEPVEAEQLEAGWHRRRWTVCVTSHQESSSEILWVRNGCNLQSTVVDLGYPGLQLVGPADDLDVDASGYSLVENSKLDERLSEARAVVESIIKLLKSQNLKSALTPSEKEAEVLTRFNWF